MSLNVKKTVVTICLGLCLSWPGAGLYAHSENKELTYDSPACQITSSWCVGRYKPKFKPKPQPAPKPLPKPKVVDYLKDEMLLLYDSTKPNYYADQLMNRYNLNEKRSDELASVQTRMITVGTNGQDPLKLAHSINNEEEDIEANLSSLFYTSNLAERSNEASGSGYPLALTGVTAIHRFTRGAGVKIGMIDTPVDLLHRSLNTFKVKRIELSPQGGPDNQRHGTEVAGILVSQNPRIGIAPEASLYAVSAFGDDPESKNRRRSDAATIAKAIDYCIREGVDILNLSFAGGDDGLVNKVVRKAIDQGIVVVASAGNGGRGAAPAFPAALENVIAVTAVDQRESIFNSANRGTYIDLAAPGVDILTTSPRGAFNVASGTSLATAHVTGVIALLMSLNRQGFDSNILNNTAIDLGAPGQDPEYGHGLINVERALVGLGVASKQLKPLNE